MPDVGPRTEKFCAAYAHDFVRMNLGTTTYQVYCRICPFSCTMTTELNEYETADAVEAAKRIAEAALAEGD